MTESEVWKDVVGYEGLYQVSNKGNIYSVERKDTVGRKCGGRMLQLSYHSNGYLRVNLSKNVITKQHLIHRLVAQAFVPNQNNYLEINHKDENKANNNVENLEWCTREYNMNYGTRNERANQTQSKKVMAINIKTGEILTFNSTKEAVSEGYFDASRACRGIYGRSGNLYKEHRWSYE